MHTVKCYGGPAHGHTMDLDDLTARQSRRFEVMGRSTIDRPRYAPWPLDLRIPPPPLRITSTYYLQTYEQTGRTDLGAVVYRQLQVALLEGADLMLRERHELEDAMQHTPWTWSKEPSFLYQFEQWWEKALQDVGWQSAIVHY